MADKEWYGCFFADMTEPFAVFESRRLAEEHHPPHLVRPVRLRLLARLAPAEAPQEHEWKPPSSS